MPGRLFICATPIGNLSDSSARLAAVLDEVEVIAAEDTRRARKLLTHLGVRTRCVSYHDGNETERAAELVRKLQEGVDVALISEGGMPLVSDPGFRLVRAAIDAGCIVTVVPGPSAVLAALTVSGLPTSRFVFEGFLPKTGAQRQRRLGELSLEERTLVVFEAPGRVLRTLGEMRIAWGGRRVAVARELTKIHEEVLRGTLDEVITDLTGREIKGEIVIVVEGAKDRQGDLATAVKRARDLVDEGNSPSQAAAKAASEAGLPKREVYGALIRPGSR